MNGSYAMLFSTKCFRMHSDHVIILAFVALFDIVQRNDIVSIVEASTVAGGRVLDIAVDSTMHSIISSSVWRSSLVLERPTVQRELTDQRPQLELTEEATRLTKTDTGCNRGDIRCCRAEILAAYVLGALMDVDHFLAARSPTLKAATNLSTRRWMLFHNPFFVATSAVLLCRYKTIRLRWACLWVSSAMSHLLRDATRTGLLLFPLGKTAPLPYVLFLVAVVAMPKVCSTLVLKMERHSEIDGDLNIVGTSQRTCIP
mmetsp:Transcript_54478/g.162796  ORF Transcript_54478/g.162796 Transcript_54478/m.162796 type:complete len:258 (-) Transcript_54478:216-989(-)